MALYPCTNNAEFDKLLDGSITKVNSSVNSLRTYVFINCVNLASVNLPNVSILANSAFQGCTSLTELDFTQEITFIGPNCFNGCSTFERLILRYPRKPTLISYNAFNSTQFAASGTGGILYVPQAMISTYQSDSIWAAVLALNSNNQILAIEGSPYEN